MRRVVLILLAVMLVPTMATATSYRCMYDGETRSACCCPKQTPHGKAPAQEPVLRAACCCEITKLTPAARPLGTTATSDLPSLAVRVAVTLDPVFAPAPVRIAAIERPRAQGDPPPSTLLARHCSLLL